MRRITIALMAVFAATAAISADRSKREIRQVYVRAHGDTIRLEERLRLALMAKDAQALEDIRDKALEVGARLRDGFSEGEASKVPERWETCMNAANELGFLAGDLVIPSSEKILARREQSLNRYRGDIVSCERSVGIKPSRRILPQGL